MNRRGLRQRAREKLLKLAALRHLFYILVSIHAVLLNPLHLILGVRHPFGEGRPPKARVKQARRLLASIKTEDVYGLRVRISSAPLGSRG